MTVIYRPARPEDLAATDLLVVANINDLTIRHGFGPMARSSPPNFQLFSLEDDPDGLTRLRRLGPIPASESGFHVTELCRCHKPDETGYALPRCLGQNS